MNSGRSGSPALAVAALSIAFAALAGAFVWQPTLGTFADDSVSYLVMGQVFSPWHASTRPVAEAFVREAFYPPLFPLALALAGAAHDFAWAHVLTALLLAGSLPVLYLLASRWLSSRWTAAAVVAMAALLPSLWVHVRGILSEPLFSLLLMAALCLIDRNEEPGKGRYWILVLLMAALALTRTVGLIVAGAYGAWALTRRGPAAQRVRAALPALAAAGAYAVWLLLRPAGTSDEYMAIVAERTQAISAAESPLAAALASLARQANAIAEAWSGALLLFWVEGSPLRPALAAAVGVLALTGLAWRFVGGRADAWVIAAYLATLLAWPFYDQMGRFLFPVLPVLVLYAFWLIERALQAAPRRAALAQGVLALLMLSLVVPALAFIAQRARSPGPYTAIIDWYRTPDLEQARARARVQLALLADMEEIRRLTRPEDRIMWVAPAYIALLAERRAVSAPPAEAAPADYRRAVAKAGADYVFLSTYHPRDTVREAAWRSGLAALEGRGQAVHQRSRDGNSMLLRIESARLARGER